MKPVAVIGGGISGLSAAFYLKKAGIPYLIFEKGTPGGAIRSQDLQGTVTDLGPNTLRDRDGALTEVIGELGLNDQTLPISEAFKTRTIVRNGSLHSLTPSPLSFMNSGVMSLKGKLRMFKEPFVPAGHRAGEDESVAAFLKHRIGKEAVEALADPVLSGIYAGNIHNMSKQEVLGKLAHFELEYGSLVKGFIRQKKSGGSTPSVLNFKGGIQTLTDGLAAASEGSFIQEEVLRIERSDEGYMIHTIGSTRHCSAVISCVPAYVLATLIRQMDTTLPDQLDQIKYAPIMTTQVIFEKDRMHKDYDGFGFLVPRSEGLRLLGVIWKSNIFPQHTAEGLFHMNILSGGAHDKFGHDDVQQVQTQVIGECKKLMDLNTEPLHIYSYLWEKGIPQFHVGYAQIRKAVTAFCKQNPDFIVGGNYIWGVSVPDCVNGAKNSVKEHFIVQNS